MLSHSSSLATNQASPVQVNCDKIAQEAHHAPAEAVLLSANVFALQVQVHWAENVKLTLLQCD